MSQITQPHLMMPTPERPRAPAGAARAVVIAAATAVVAALALRRWLALDAAFLWTVLVLAPLCGAALVTLVATRSAGARFGRANEVTLARGAIVLLLVALLTARPDSAIAWLVVLLATLAASLDGVDGWLARRHGEASAFGARFDMETDALLIFALAGLAWLQDKAGPWILLAGALRYGFVAASALRPWLGRALPPSRRRQTVCVLQVVSLIVCIAPLVPPPLSSAVAAAGLALLVWSFGVDVAWLARRAAEPLP